MKINPDNIGMGCTKISRKKGENTKNRSEIFRKGREKAFYIGKNEEEVRTKQRENK